EGVEHGGAYAARRGGAGDNHAVAAEQGKVARHVGAEEAGRLLLVDHDVLWRRRNRCNDLVAINVGHQRAYVLAVAVILPAPGARIPVVVAAHAGGVDHRHPLVVALVDERADIGERGPGVFAAGIAPLLDRLEDRLGLVAAECPVYVDDDERGALTEAAAGAVAGGFEDRPVAFSKKLVPDGLRHASSCSSCCSWHVLGPK